MSTSGAVRLQRLGLVVLVAGACAVVGCSNPAPAGQQTAVPSSAPAASGPATVAEILPAGAGREAVLNNCGSCHNLACSAIGQRTGARWDSLKESHVEKVSSGDLEAAFAYLKATFNESKPEPMVPAKFLEGGCTPF